MIGPVGREQDPVPQRSGASSRATAAMTWRAIPWLTHAMSWLTLLTVPAQVTAVRLLASKPAPPTRRARGLPRPPRESRTGSLRAPCPQRSPPRNAAAFATTPTTRFRPDDTTAAAAEAVLQRHVPFELVWRKFKPIIKSLTISQFLTISHFLTISQFLTISHF